MLERVSETLRPAVPRARGVRTMLAVALLTVASFAAAVELRGDHPDTYVVKRGDTLWDIAGRFLQRPWLWPEIWQANPQVKNPHLIYPGDVLSLAYLDRVAMQPGQRSESAGQCGPLSEIEPFLKDLRIVDSFDGLPYVVGLEDDRLRSSRGQQRLHPRPGRHRPRPALPGGPRGEALPLRRARRPVLRPVPERGSRCPRRYVPRHRRVLDQCYVFPSKNTEMLGYELITQVHRHGDPRRSGRHPGLDPVARRSGREVRVGDRLVPVEAQPYDLQFFPHAPASSSRLRPPARAGGGRHLHARAARAT
jgi:hypothetical protein